MYILKIFKYSIQTELSKHFKTRREQFIVDSQSVSFDFSLTPEMST